MTTAPKRGGGAQQDKMKPSRLAPEGFEEKSNLCHPGYSARHAQNQEQPPATRVPPPHILIPARIRRLKISELVWYRHRGPCRTDDAILYFEAIAPHLVICCPPGDALEFAVNEWTSKYTPELSARDIAEVMDRVRTYRRISYRSKDIGQHLCLQYEEKVALHITHIDACDISAADLVAIKSATERDRVNNYRWTTGKVKTPRSMSLARRVPRLEGESNEAFYKRAKALVANSQA